MNDRYLVEFRFSDLARGVLTPWQTLEGVTPQTMRDVVELIAEHHPAHTTGRHNTDGHLRVTYLPHDAGHRDVTEGALDAFGRWHLEARGRWPTWLDVPAWVECAA